jgi:large subunit ribosomal protein L24
MNIKKNDMVSIIGGNYRGKVAKVLHVDPDKNRLIVEGINMIKRHTRPTRQNAKGGIITKEAPIHRSNVKLYCSSCHSPTRAGFKILDIKGSKVTKTRFCRKCGAEL